jgi:hypothetical protein
MAGIRFPGTAHHHGWLDFGGVTGGFSGAVLSAPSDYIFRANEPSRVYIAPSRYSKVRRVTFSIVFRHEHNSTAPAWTFSSRIAPSSSTAATRTVESASIPQSSNQQTVGPSAIWSGLFPTTDAAFYPLNGSETALIPRPVAIPGTTSDSQILVVDYDRDDSGAADFFSDWDAIAAIGDDDEYMAFWPGIQRNDLLPFSGGLGDKNREPTIVGLGIAVVQAPSEQNDSCTTIPATNGLYPDNSIQTSYTGIRIIPFNYRVDDWDGIESICLILRQSQRNAAVINGDYTVRIRSWVNGSLSPTATILEQGFDPGSSGSVNYVQRTQDVKDLLSDGQILAIDFKSDSGFGDQNFPWGHWEIIQKDLTKKTTFHPMGMGNAFTTSTMEPGPPPPDAWGMDQSLFDPDWYENLPLSLFLHQRWYGAYTHYGVLFKDSDQAGSVNSDLGADIPNSAFNQLTDEVSSTPDADDGVRTQYFTITRVNPLLLSGRRAMKLKYGLDDWIQGTDDQPGAIGFAYTYTVLNVEFPELGPLFEIGAFNPEGCASTAAGLGDNPGILFLANGSTVPKKFNPVADNIENAGIDTPYRDEEPTATLASIALSPDGGLTPGIYTYRYTLRNCCHRRVAGGRGDLELRRRDHPCRSSDLRDLRLSHVARRRFPGHGEGRVFRSERDDLVRRHPE